MCDHVGPARNRRKRRNDSRRCRWRRKNNAWNCKRRSVTDGAWVVVVPLEQTLVIDVEKNIACQGQVFIRSAIAKHSYQYQKVLSLSLWSWLLLQFAIMYIYIYMYRCPVISIAHVTQYTYDRIGKRVFFWLIWLARDCCIVVYLIVLCMISDQLFIWIFHRCLQRKAIHAWPYHNYISLYQYQISHLSIRFGFYWYHFTIILHWFLNLECQILFSIYHFWLVVWNMNFMFPYIGNVMIPTDEVHHFSEG